MKKTTFLLVGVAVASAALLLSSCTAGADAGGDTPTKAASTTADLTPGYFGDNEGSGDPVSGGTLTFGYTGGIISFDPATQQYAGSSGGDEANAVYGTLAVYDPVSDSYGPGMAESVESNADLTVWTVKLRDGVTFTDGTPYDAAAVKFNTDRLSASKKGWSALWNGSVASVDATDASTVTFTLTRPWADFPFLLSQAPGMIASPAAVQAEGDNYLNKPVGAGAFILKSWTPGQSVELTPNADYWDGAPYLDDLVFQTVTGGDQAASEALANGDIQGTFISQDPSLIVANSDPATGNNGFIRLANTSSMLLINNGTKAVPDAPGKDPNVRMAISSAIDPTVVDERVNGGKGIPGTDLWLSNSKWANDEPGIPYDLEAAKSYLQKAKDAGFDGKIDMIYLQDSQDTGLTIQAQLQAAGFEVTATPQAQITDLITHVLINQDYQLAVYGWPVPDEPGELYTSYQNRFGMQGNQLGFYNADLEKALQAFAAASDDATKKEALTTVQKLWTENAPAVSLGGSADLAVWSSNVHGVTVSSRTILDFAKAWISQ